MSKGDRPKADATAMGWESTEFPILCETCLGDNAYVRMQVRVLRRAALRARGALSSIACAPTSRRLVRLPRARSARPLAARATSASGRRPSSGGRPARRVRV